MVIPKSLSKITTKDEVIYGEGLSQIKILPNTSIKKISGTIMLNNMPMSSGVIILICLLLSAFFSGMEIAFVSANKLKVELDKQSGMTYSRFLKVFCNHQQDSLPLCWWVTTLLWSFMV